LINIRLLPVFRATSEQENDLPPGDGVIDALAWPEVQFHLEHAITHWLGHAKMALRRPVDPCSDSRLHPCVTNGVQPCLLNIHIISG
jgi:hypothetical protein